MRKKKGKQLKIRVYSSISYSLFTKTPTIQEISKDGLNSLKETISSIASIEGLKAHKKRVEKRV